MNSQDKELLKIAERLKELPKIEDERSKEEVYSSIMEKVIERNERKKRITVLPFIAASVAILLVIPFIPSLFENREEMGIKENETIYETDTVIEEGNIFTAHENQKFYMYALKENVLIDGYSIVTIPYTAQSSSIIVPLSFMVRTDIDALQQVKQLIAQFDPHFFGLEHTLLKTMDLSMSDESELVIHIPASVFSEVQKSFKHFTQSVEIFAKSLNYDRVKIETSEPLNKEEMMSEWEISNDQTYSYYILETSTQHMMLTPVATNGLSFSETLENMKTAPNDSLQPSIPEKVTFQIEERESGVSITIDGVDRSDEMTVNMLQEAILLTARDFGYDYVEFYGLNQEEIKHSTKLAPNGM